MNDFDKETVTAPRKHVNAKSAAGDDFYLPALAPESYSKCVECHAPTAGDVCSDECRVQWSTRWDAVSDDVSRS